MIAAATIVFFFIVTIATIITSTYFSKKNTVLRKLKACQTKSISGFNTSQPTKVTGKVLSVTNPFIAPYSKRACIAYNFEVKQRVSNGKHTRWRILIRKEKIQDFFIENNGELVMIKPMESNYLLYMEEDKRVESGIFNKPNEKFVQVLKDLGIENENWLGFNKRLKYTERIIEVGETVTVGGIAKLKSLNKPIEGYNYSKIAVLESNETQRLIITDTPEART
ncbi:hypothetical protein [Neotamlana laminarinivorans]|uniref:RING-type E3 ubiquitin transferase n=1 Tax=Neotamlana laminarinivorans TaxID=2883124 RepID=A0A9X1HZM1_9FLAO|nr:hypothetical protein [Tamlana laminarinivorans]MCB4798501.1 hypothetical protein [Tamlana laminarinivorans]